MPVPERRASARRRRTGMTGIGNLPRPAFTSPDSVRGVEASRVRVPFPLGKLGVRLPTLNLECKLEGRTPVRWDYLWISWGRSNALRAFRVVASAMSPASSPLASATDATTIGMFAGALSLPLTDWGARNGLP